jgi:hypothetical protein
VGGDVGGEVGGEVAVVEEVAVGAVVEPAVVGLGGDIESANPTPFIIPVATKPAAASVAAIITLPTARLSICTRNLLFFECRVYHAWFTQLFITGASTSGL